MKPIKILLLGKNGQVGWELQRSLAILGNVTSLDSTCTNYCGDFTNLDGLAQTVRAIAPDVIVNAAAHTAVDKAESEPDLARAINALAVGVLATEAKNLALGWCTIQPTMCLMEVATNLEMNQRRQLR